MNLKIINHKIFLNIILIGCLIFISSACNNKNVDPELIKRIEEYYTLEKEKKWEQTYSFRTPLFQSSVPKKNYIMGIKKEMGGWSLKKYKIKNYKAKDNLAEVEIYFKETHPSKPTKRITQTTTWEKIDGIWYGRNVGSRLHLFFNEDLVIQ